MIETTIKTVDGVTFLSNIKILEPDETIGGFGVHYIPDRIADSDAELMRAIKLLGLKKVDRSYPRRADIYAQFPIPFLPIKIIQFGLRVYWSCIRWLYDNARIFKQVPESQPFSWKYFTPYVWYKNIRKRN